MKELWVEIASNASSSEKGKLLKLATDNADFLLEDTHARDRSGKNEITVLKSYDANAITQLKHNGKKVALEISIKGKEVPLFVLKRSVTLRGKGWYSKALENAMDEFEMELTKLKLKVTK